MQIKIILYSFITKNLILFLLLIIFVLYFVLREISKYKNIKDNKVSLNELKKFPELFLKYLDSFYITNMYYTIFGSIIYCFSNIILFLIIRLLYIGNQTTIMPINFAYFSYHTVFVIILCIMILILLKTLLETLFYKEILKLHLYAENWPRIIMLFKYFEFFHVEKFTGPLNLFLFCVSTLKNMPADEDDDYQDFYFYKNIYEKPFIFKLNAICVFYSKKFIIIHWLFKTLYYIWNIIYKQLIYQKFALHFFYIISFVILFYDFIHFKFHYIYYYIIILYIINIMFKQFSFFANKNFIYDNIISEYFYKNEFKYEVQRVLIFNTNLFYKNMKIKSEQNAMLHKFLNHFDDFHIYVYKNLHENLGDIEAKKRFREIYLMCFFIIIFVIVAFYLLFYNSNYIVIINIIKLKIPVLIIVIPLFIILCLAPQIYVLPKDAKDDFINNYSYKKLYTILLWFLVFLQTIILIIFFYKTNILETFSDDACWNNYGITIYRNYTLQEKQEYFKYYFNFFLSQNTYMYDLEQIISLLEFKDLILNDIKAKTQIMDIQEALKTIFVNINLDNNFTYFKDFFNTLNVEKPLKLYLDYNNYVYCIKNITNIIVFWEFFVCYLDAYMEINKPFSIQIFKIIYQWIKTLKGY